mgnify:FL=1
MEDQYQDSSAYIPQFEYVSTTKKPRVTIKTLEVETPNNSYTIDLENECVDEIPFEDIHEISNIIKQYFDK